MIFLTVGTQFPFDRLVKAVDYAFSEGLIQEEVFAQVGASAYRPRNFESVPRLDTNMFDKLLKKASSMIGHAGIGTIATALHNHKPLLVMPRLKKYDAVVNDHQLAIAKRFEQMGHILVAYEVEELPGKIARLSTFVPQRREVRTKQVADRISRFLTELVESGG